MKKMHTSAVGAPTSDPLDTVHLYLEQDELVIAPANILPEEALLRPVLPVDGGWLCVELRTQSGDDINFGYMGGVVDSDDVPLWVELVYGHAVVEAARALLGSSGTDRSQGNAVVETRWHSEPTETTRCLVRLAMGMWIRRYWPSPTAQPLPQPDHVLLDLELASLSLRGQVPGCFGLGGITSSVLGDSVGIVEILAEHVIKGTAAPYLHRRLRIVLRDLLNWVLEGEEAGVADSRKARLAQLREDLGRHLRSCEEDQWALAAGPQPHQVAEHPANPDTSYDSVDWGLNVQGLLDTDTNSVTWEHDGDLLRISVRLSPARLSEDTLPQVHARVYRQGIAMPLLVDLAVDGGGHHFVGTRRCGQEGIECVDIVSVERPAPALRGEWRQEMVREQEEATAWARKRSSVLDSPWQRDPGEALPDNPVPADLDRVTREPWLAEETTLDKLFRPVAGEGESAAALEHSEAAHALDTNSEDTQLQQADCLFNEGNALADMGQHTAALERYQEAHALYAAIEGTEVQQADCLRNADKALAAMESH